MKEETRSDKMFDELASFLADENLQNITMYLYGSEVKKLKKYLSQKEIPVIIAGERTIQKGRLNITLKKL